MQLTLLTAGGELPDGGGPLHGAGGCHAPAGGRQADPGVDLARPRARPRLGAAQLPHGRGARVPRALDTPALRSTQGQICKHLFGPSILGPFFAFAD